MHLIRCAGQRDMGETHRDLRGYMHMEDEIRESSYEPLYPGVDQWTDMEPVMEEYFNRIVDLCADRGLLFFDFNEYRFYEACGYDYLHDNADDSHPNLSGARKLTDFVGQLLRDVYFLRPVKAESFEKTREAWRQRV